MLGMKTEPRNKTFSVSFTESGLKKLKKRIEQLHADTGYKISRNQFVYKATMAAIEYQRLVESGEWKNVSFDEIFKSIE